MDYSSRQARLVRSSDAHRYLWGDPESRYVVDWYHVSTDKIHFAVFSLAPRRVLETLRQAQARVSTENLTMGLFPLLPGAGTEAEVHAGDEFAYVASGTAAVFLPDTGEYFEMRPGDGAFTPQGVRHQYFNHSGDTATVIFGVAPAYR